VPDYARNFLNVPLISYSGEIDAQRDSAEYMMEVLGKEGLHPKYLIGPGMPHKYHPDTLKELQGLIEKEVEKGRNPMPKEVHLQTRTLAYNKMFWVKLTEMQESWKEARVDATFNAKTGVVTLTTQNARQLEIQRPPGASKLVIDGKAVTPGTDTSGTVWTAMFGDGIWADQREKYVYQKEAGLSGSMDDAFKSRFMIVLPDGKAGSAAVDAWTKNEAEHFLKRWRGLMRGDALVKKASDVTPKDMEQYNLVLWGDSPSNSLIAKLLGLKKAFPLQWSSSTVSIGKQEFDASTHVPVLCWPNILAKYPSHYIILNSGLTFREAHDKTNSLQNPKLPDWAILDISQPPTAESAGKVVAADFFDEYWKVKPDMPPVDAK
jgi:hypothetical protein